MKKAVTLLIVGVFAAVAAGSAAAEPFVLEPIGTSTLFTPGESSVTTPIWSLKIGKPEVDEAATQTTQGADATIITPTHDGWLRSLIVGLGSKGQIRVDLRRGGDELLPAVLRGMIRPLLARLISEIAVYRSGVRVNFRSGVSEAEIRSAAGQSGMQIAPRE